jgi:hypothetical protein
MSYTAGAPQISPHFGPAAPASLPGSGADFWNGFSEKNPHLTHEKSPARAARAPVPAEKPPGISNNATTYLHNNKSTRHQVKRIPKGLLHEICCWISHPALSSAHPTNGR